jgi:aminopeptidase N
MAVSRLPMSAQQAVDVYSDPAHRGELSASWEQGLSRLLDAAEPGSDHQLAFMRAFAGAARSETALDRLAGILDGSVVVEGLAVDADLRWTLLKALAARARADEAAVAAELASDNTIAGQERAAAALASRPTAEAKETAWTDAVVRDDVPNETQRSVALAFNVPGQEDVLRPFLARYLDAAVTIWEEKGTQRASTILEYMFPRALVDADTLEAVDAWLESSDANPAAKRYVREGRADIARALAAQARDAR